VSTDAMMQVLGPNHQVRISEADEHNVQRLAQLHPKTAEDAPNALRSFNVAIEAVTTALSRQTGAVLAGSSRRYLQYQLSRERRLPAIAPFEWAEKGTSGRSAALAFARVLASLCGHEVAPITVGHGYSPRAAVRAILGQIGRYLTTASDALADDKLSSDELVQLDRAVDALMDGCTTYRAARLHAAMDTGN
jgi:hypothetical protein